MIELLNKPGLFLLAALAPLILLYVLKVKRERKHIGSILLFAEAKRDLLAKHPFRKLLPERSLILQALALIALALVLARPASRGQGFIGDHLAIVIDTSASMSATVNGEASIERAKRAALELLDNMQPGADAMLVDGGHEPILLASLDRDVHRLKTLVQGLEAHDVEGELAHSMALAAERLRALPGTKKVVLITDGYLASKDFVTVSGVLVDVVRVGGNEEENVALTRIDVRSGLDPKTHREEAQVFAMVQNLGKKAREVYVTLTIDGARAPLASRRFLAEPGKKEPVVLSFEPTALDEGKGLTVALNSGDAFPADDVAYGRVPGRRRMPVVLASNAKASWLERALDSDPEVDLQTVSLEELPKINIDPGALVVVEGDCPESIPGLDALIVAPNKDCGGIEVGGVVEHPNVTSWENGDARFRFVSLDGIHIARSRALKASGSRASLVRAETTTIVADISTPGRTMTLLGFDVGESDWPLKASFVLFMRNIVETARLHRSQGTAAAAHTGEALRVPVPQGVLSVWLTGPKLAEREIPVRGGFAVLPAALHAGLYDVRWLKPQVAHTTIAVNLTSENESRLAPVEVPIRVERGELVVKDAPATHREWGKWLAAVAIAFLLVDLFFFTRKTRRRTPSPARASALAEGTK